MPDTRTLEAPGAPLGASKPPMQAGAYRAALIAFVVLLTTAISETIRQATGLPPWVYVVWSPVLAAAPRMLEAWIDARSVAA